MLLSILIMLKTILYISITNIEYNKLTILIFTTVVSATIIALIEFFGGRKRKLGQVIYYSIISIIIFIDVMYYSYFQSLPSIAIIGQAKQLSAVGDSIRVLLTAKNILTIIDLPLVIYYVLKKQGEREYTKNMKRNILLGLVGGICLAFGVMVKTDNIPSLKTQEIYTYHIVDIIDTYFRSESIAAEDINALAAFKHEPEINIEDRKHFGIGKDKNLIVIQVEALQNFVVNLNYNGQEITPNINKLIKDQNTIYFEEYFQLVGRGNTSDAEFVTNNSLHPSMEDFTYSQYGDNTFYGLPWLLRDNGYNVWAFHGYEKEFWNREDAYVNQGYQRFLSEEDYEYDKEDIIGFGIKDEDFLDQTIDYLKELDGIDDNPFYGFVVTLSSHTPYTMDEKYHVLDIKDPQKGNMVGNYLQAIHYTDREIGRFIENLKKEGLYEDTVIAIYGDHFGVTNSIEEVFDPMEDILGEPYNFDHVMNIPLIIHVPGEDINETVSTVGSQIDFYPTILNIMGYENEKGLMIGKDLLNYDGYAYIAPQTIMRKGSFLDKDIMFNIAQDGIFEHSTVTDRKTREELDVRDYRETYDMVISEINRSNLILKEDLLKHMVATGGDINSIRISTETENLPSQKKIKTYDKYEIDDLTDLYNKRKKMIRINVNSRTTDLEKLEAWMEEHEDAYLILKTDEKGTEFLEEIKSKYPELRDRYIAEINDLTRYFYVDSHGYDNIILNIIDQDYNDETLVELFETYKYYGVVMDKERSKTSLPKKLKDLGLKVYVEDRETKELKLHK